MVRHTVNRVCTLCGKSILAGFALGLILIFTLLWGVGGNPKPALAAPSRAPARQTYNEGDWRQVTPIMSGTLAAGEVVHISMPVAALDTAEFSIVSNGPLTATLITPAGDIIDPSTPDADPTVHYMLTEPDDEEYPTWMDFYYIETPDEGVWQVALTAEADAQYWLGLGGVSPVEVWVETDKREYGPQETVTVQAAVLKSDGGHSVLQKGFAFTGTVEIDYRNTVPFTLYDDGSHGDIRAGNGVYTGQFTAPAENSELSVIVQAAKGNVMRFATVPVQSFGWSGEIIAVANDRGIDDNDNGYFDKLTVDVVVDVGQAGHYEVTGVLLTPDGDWIDTALFTTYATDTPLATGVNTITLGFDGKALRGSGSGGPYKIDLLSVDYFGEEFYGSATVASARNIYTTSVYAATQFEGAELSVVKASSAVVDDSGDGLYDQLEISVTFTIQERGNYSWRGSLVDKYGNLITRANDRGWLDSKTPAVFTFSGPRLRQVGRSGPYTLTEVFIVRETEPVDYFWFSNVHVTAPYQFDEFGPLTGN
jgi:hypothetical protein